MSLQASSKLKVAYITTSFSSLSHTFIRREIEALRVQGVEIGLFGVRRDRSAIDWDSKTFFLYPISIKQIIFSLVKVILKKPKGFRNGLIAAVFNEELNPYQHLKLIYHFFISLPHAERMIRDGYSHIHAHFINVPATIAMYCSIISDIPFSFTCHSAGEIGLREVIGVRQKFRKASFVRLISNFLKTDLADYLKNTKNVHVIRCGLDFSGYELRKNTEAMPTYKILAIGRLVEKKGFIYLIEALGVLKKEGFNFVLQIVGEGPLLGKLKSLAEERQISKDVRFLLKRTSDEVETILSLADVLVVPSVTAETGEKEGLPTVIVEAMRACTPVVASEHSGIPEIVINRETGLLVSEKDNSQLANAIKEILTNQGLKETLVRNAFFRARDDFDAKKINNSLIALFSKASI